MMVQQNYCNIYAQINTFLICSGAPSVVHVDRETGEEITTDQKNKTYLVAYGHNFGAYEYM